MNRTTPLGAADSHYELWFLPLAKANTPPHAFACDAAGRIDLDALSDHDRDEYLFARALVGLDFGRPTVRGVADPVSRRRLAAEPDPSRSAP